MLPMINKELTIVLAAYARELFRFLPVAKT